jgi:hypothetical protein
MRKRTKQSRWENVPAVARALAGSAVDTGIPGVGGTCHKQGTLPPVPARLALESSP